MFLIFRKKLSFCHRGVLHDIPLGMQSLAPVVSGNVPETSGIDGRRMESAATGLYRWMSAKRKNLQQPLW